MARFWKKPEEDIFGHGENVFFCFLCFVVNKFGIKFSSRHINFTDQ